MNRLYNPDKKENKKKKVLIILIIAFTIIAAVLFQQRCCKQVWFYRRTKRNARRADAAEQSPSVYCINRDRLLRRAFGARGREYKE